MPKANLSPNAVFTRRQRFEEVELIFQTAGMFRGGMLDGEFELSFEADGSWWVSDVSVSTIGVERGRMVDKMIAVTPAEQPELYGMIVDSIVFAYQAHIPEWVQDELIAEGVSLREAA